MVQLGADALAGWGGMRRIESRFGPTVTVAVTRAFINWQLQRPSLAAGFFDPPPCSPLFFSSERRSSFHILAQARCQRQISNSCYERTTFVLLRRIAIAIVRTLSPELPYEPEKDDDRGQADDIGCFRLGSYISFSIHGRVGIQQ